MRIAAQQLLIKAGSSKLVCEEADKLFQKYKNDSYVFLDQSELKSDYPAIASLGRVYGIEPEEPKLGAFPGSPSYIRVRVGTHFDGFFIDIVERDSAYRYQTGALTLEIVKNRIYASR
jgi:hypothetical protein